MAKLKVFRTPIGFHDAYVAAPSQKAALKAWGADANLFARGLAEEIDEPELTREPLSRPGEVFRVKRGTDAEHFRALPKRSVRTAPNSKAETTMSAISRPGERETGRTAKPAPSKLAPPKPSRDVLDRAEMSLTTAENKYKAAMQALAAKERALKEERQTLLSDYRKTVARLSDARDSARTSYQKLIEDWENDLK